MNFTRQPVPHRLILRTDFGQGWQSVQSLHELDDFRDLVSCVHRAVPGILRFLKIGYDAYEVTACWATVLAKGAAHKMHQHPNNFLIGFLSGDDKSVDLLPLARSLFMNQYREVPEHFRIAFSFAGT
jgi:hypothetical protein